MNKTYRIIYNHHTGTYVAVAENTHARGKASRAGKALSTVAVGAVLALSSMNAAAVEFYATGGWKFECNWHGHWWRWCVRSLNPSWSGCL